MMLIDWCVGSNSKQTFELTILMKLDCVTVLILFTFISEKSEILLVNYNSVKPFFFKSSSLLIVFSLGSCWPRN